MKKFLFIFSVVLPLLFLSSCSKNDSLSPSSPDVKSSGGKLLLKIDKNNAPADVQSVFACLTRTGFDSLYKSMNLRTDSTADISFSSITIGTWHLKVDAKSAAGTVLYTGECDVTVSEGVTTQVSLTLNPVAMGVGNIQINVSWGSGSHWLDYAQNPIFKVSDSPTNPYGGVSTAKVIYDDGKYKMWYLNTYQSGRGDIGYAESADGIKWVSACSTSVLLAGSFGNWDDYTVAPGAVIKENGLYKMYYSGYRDQHNAYNIGMATSQDGIYWEKHHDPIIPSTSTEYQLGGMDVIKCESTYFLFYTSRNSDVSNGRLNVATSSDGINWTRYSNNPIISQSQAWEGNGIAFATVVYENGQFKLLYMNLACTGFGLATSTDGFHWTKDAGNPVFKLSDVANQWCTRIQYPFWKKFGNQYRLYYTGTTNGVNSIALATKAAVN